MEKRLRDLPARTRPMTAPATASGMMVRTVTGWRNELNWEASTMYATRRANARLPVVSSSCEAWPPATTR